MSPTSQEPVTPEETHDDTSTAPSEPGDYARVLFTNDALPSAVGDIAKMFQDIPPEAQRADAEAFFDFLTFICGVVSAAAISVERQVCCGFCHGNSVCRAVPTFLH